MVERAGLGDALGHAADVGDRLRRVLDRVDALGRERGMALEAVHMGARAELALVRADDAHAGRLADHAGHRLHRALAQLGDQPAHADAADLLVIGEGEMQRRLELRLRELGRHRQQHGDEALHVAGAAAVEQAVLLRHRERVGRPVLAVDRAPRRYGPTASGRAGRRGPNVANRLAFLPVSSKTSWDSMPSFFR